MRSHHHSHEPYWVLETNTHVHNHRNHHRLFTPGQTLCCGALLGLACFSPRFAFTCILGIVAIVTIACLASLAMSVTAEALLSVLLIGAIAGGIAYLCKSNGFCATQQPTPDTNITTAP